MTRTLILVVSLFIASAANAGMFSTKRGYDSCLNAAESMLTSNAGMVAERFYLHNKSAEDQHFYINASAFVDGDRSNIGISCKTNLTGHRVLDIEKIDARYVLSDDASAPQGGFAAE